MHKSLAHANSLQFKFLVKQRDVAFTGVNLRHIEGWRIVLRIEAVRDHTYVVRFAQSTIEDKHIPFHIYQSGNRCRYQGSVVALCCPLR